MKIARNKISFTITSYNRYNILKKDLEYLMRISTIQDCNIIIVQQDINQKFDNLFKKIKHNKVYIIKKKHPKKYNPNRKMILNGVKGFKFIFESLESDICFYVEDNIALSGDAIKFGSSIIEKYKYDDNFFGVNFFSKMKYDKKKLKLYSKFIYGIGKGWGVEKRRWLLIKKLLNKNFIYSIDAPLYDWPLEKYIKENLNYVVMPINSRSFEIPSDGVNVNIRDNQKYFKKMRASFVGTKSLNLDYKYTLFHKYEWRKDCIKYKGQIIHKIYRLLKSTIKLILKKYVL